MTAGTSILEAREIGKTYAQHRFLGPKLELRAVQNVSFSLEEGKVLAIVGESGCGKSTLARLLARLEEPTSGEIYLRGKRASDVPSPDYRRTLQMIFQDPFGSLNPRHRAGDIVAEPLRINSNLSKEACREEARAVLEKVGLTGDSIDRYPRSFSGGQCQRIGIARALILKPKILICDEPLSALDVSIQAQVLNLLLDLREQFGLSYIFISHDLSVVRHIADEVLVMYLGKIVEAGPAETIFSNPLHPYTQALLASTPEIDAGLKRKPLTGELPSPLNPPSGCSFHKRCPIAEPRCSIETPLLELKASRKVACHLVSS